MSYRSDGLFLILIVTRLWSHGSASAVVRQTTTILLSGTSLRKSPHSRPLELTLIRNKWLSGLSANWASLTNGLFITARIAAATSILASGYLSRVAISTLMPAVVHACSRK